MPKVHTANITNTAIPLRKSLAGDDAALIHLCGEILAGYVEADRLHGDGNPGNPNLAAIRAIVASVQSIRARVATMPALTLAGWRAKAAVLAHLHGEDDALALSLAEDVLAGSA